MFCLAWCPGVALHYASAAGSFPNRLRGYISNDPASFVTSVAVGTKLYQV